MISCELKKLDRRVRTMTVHNRYGCFGLREFINCGFIIVELVNNWFVNLKFVNHEHVKHDLINIELILYALVDWIK